MAKTLEFCTLENEDLYLADKSIIGYVNHDHDRAELILINGDHILIRTDYPHNVYGQLGNAIESF